MSKVGGIAYRLVDPNSGFKGDWYFVRESCDNICIGVTDGAGKYHQYDSYEGYHSHAWAVQRGLEVQSHEFTVELPA